LERLGGLPTRESAPSNSRGESQSQSETVRDDARRDGAWDGWSSALSRTGDSAADFRPILLYQSLTASSQARRHPPRFQQLYELHQAGAFELEVVDTPPASHSFEFLRRRRDVIRLLDSRTARWLFTPSLSAGANRDEARERGGALRGARIGAGRGAERAFDDLGFFSPPMAESMDAIVDRLQRPKRCLHSPAVSFRPGDYGGDRQAPTSARAYRRDGGGRLNLAAIGRKPVPR